MTSGGSALDRWGRFAVRKRWWVVGAWVIVLVVMAGVMRTVSKGTSNNLDLPGSESQQAVDVLRTSFPERSGDYADVVFAAPAGIDDPAARP